MGNANVSGMPKTEETDLKKSFPHYVKNKDTGEVVESSYTKSLRKYRSDNAVIKIIYIKAAAVIARVGAVFEGEYFMDLHDIASDLLCGPPAGQWMDASDMDHEEMDALATRLGQLADEWLHGVRWSESSPKSREAIVNDMRSLMAGYENEVPDSKRRGE